MSLIYTSPASLHNLYLGGKNDARSLATLQQRNIRRILNVTPQKEAGITAGVPNYFEGGGCGKGKGIASHGRSIQYKRIPVYDSSTSDLLTYADEIVNFISNGLHHGSVLVHCQRGVSRSATAVMMFLLRKTNMTFQQSFHLCKRRRPMVDPIPAFCDQLKEYERECRSLGYLTSVDNELAVTHGAENTSKMSSVSLPGKKDEPQRNDRWVTESKFVLHGKNARTGSGKRKRFENCPENFALGHSAGLSIESVIETAKKPSIAPPIGPPIEQSVRPAATSTRKLPPGVSIGSPVAPLSSSIVRSSLGPPIGPVRNEAQTSRSRRVDQEKKSP